MERKEPLYEEALALHRAARGKIEVTSRVRVEDRKDLSLVYTPGVAEPCRWIEKDPAEVWALTRRWNSVAVVSDGTAVLGLGDIGPQASLPVMEGKCNLFKRFADIDAFPIVLSTKDPEAIVEAVSLIAGSFGGINLEDIGAPRCFEIERKLQERVDIPVFHDDQHGTAVITLAGLLNALAVTGKKIGDIRITVNGIGAAGTAIIRLLQEAGARDIVPCGRRGVLDPDDPLLNWSQARVAEDCNPSGVRGTLADALRGADVFIGVSQPKTVTGEMVRSMAKDSILFAMANPTPEIYPDEAKSAGAAIVATGRSDFPNQVNNCLGFPGIFRGALDAGATRVTEGMKRAAARALADLVGSDLSADCVIPSPLDARVVPSVAAAVAESARLEGVCRSQAL